jgi:hypothetical protein
LNRTGITQNREIHISGGYLSLSGSQRAIILSAAISFAGNPRTYANQYDHPQANPYRLEMRTKRKLQLLEKDIALLRRKSLRE